MFLKTILILQGTVARRLFDIMSVPKRRNTKAAPLKLLHPMPVDLLQLRRGFENHYWRYHSLYICVTESHFQGLSGSTPSSEFPRPVRTGFAVPARVRCYCKCENIRWCLSSL